MNDIWYDPTKLEGLEIKHVTFAPVLAKLMPPTEYACLICEDADGREVRVMFAVTRDARPKVAPQRMIEMRLADRAAGRPSFFAEEQVFAVGTGVALDTLPKAETHQVVMTEKKPAYVRGDWTAAPGYANRILAYVMMDSGRWRRKGPCVQLAKRYPYRFQRDRPPVEVWVPGEIVEKKLANDVVAAGMIACEARIGLFGKHRLSYEALERCLLKLSRLALEQEAIVFMPFLGKGLEGWDWKEIEKLLIEYLCKNGVKVRVYGFGNKR